MKVDVLIIGGGPAGLAAAISAKKSGIDSVLILERDTFLGGILQQCIHSGFGLHRFEEELTGPEYAQRDIDELHALGILYQLNTMVLEILPDRTLLAVSAEKGLQTIEAGAIVLAMGCRERARGSISIAGSRPAGIFSAGTAQKYVNLKGYLPGKEVVVLGSGDIGLIMARRMVLEGACVKGVFELLPFSGGLRRNIVQCLDDFDIPLYYSHTITKVSGGDRLSSVTVCKVDDNLHPIPETAFDISCDTLLLSVGLLPENELSKQLGVALDPATGGPIVNESLETTVSGVFAAGNVLHVHDLVDYVSEESALAGKHAAKFVKEQSTRTREVPLLAAEGIRYVVPHSFDVDSLDEVLTVRYRVDAIYRTARVVVYANGEKIMSRKKRIFSPGEMETLSISKELLSNIPSLSSVKIALEVE